MPTFTLSGVVFFDYNGNGVRDGNEPPVAGATVKVGSVSATSGADGSYSVARVPQGKQSITVTADGFRYISLSTAAFQSTGSPASLTVSGDTRRDWGLMQGFLTLPFPLGTAYVQSIYVDLGGGRTWDGSGFTYSGHKGIDYDMPEGQIIVAFAPGVIIEAEDNWPENPRVSDPDLGLGDDGNRIIIDHGNGFRTAYAHLGGGLLVVIGPKNWTTC